jgi:hypothetical protein
VPVYYKLRCKINMKQFIETKLNEIFIDFQNELTNKRFCDLKYLRYDGVNRLNYNNPLIQKLYLLRYMPAFLVEYYDMYSKIFEQKFMNDINILSLGCGCGIDLWAAKFARDNFSPDSKIKYTGIDAVDWQYKDNLGTEDFYFLKCDISRLIELGDDYNVIIFAKSIGDLSINAISKLRKAVRNTNFSSNKIALLSSFRKTRSSVDMDRLSSIVDIFTSIHGYSSLDDKNKYWYYNIDGFGDYPKLEYICEDFVYPEEIISYLTNLNTQCYGYKENHNEPCSEDCKEMNRWPVLRASQIEYQVIRLIR